MAGDVEETLPAGPWVLVLGMHRSGTSALAGAVGALGAALPAPGDLVTGRYDNPVHNESRSLTSLDDDALRALGGSWSAPPDLAPGWAMTDPAAHALGGVRRRAPAAARRAFPRDGPVVWKDPRLCLLLPLWSTLLPGTPLPVLAWRSPLATARSLGERQGFPRSLGLALWDLYTRHALAALAGSPAYVVAYEDLVRSPRTVLAALAGWLTERGVPLRIDAATLDAAASIVARPGAGDPHAAGRVGASAHIGGSRFGTDPSQHMGTEAVPAEVAAAAAALAGSSGAHESLPVVELPAAPAWMADAVAQRAEYEALYARYMRYVRVRRRIPFLRRSVR